MTRIIIIIIMLLHTYKIRSEEGTVEGMEILDDKLVLNTSAGSLLVVVLSAKPGQHLLTGVKSHNVPLLQVITPLKLLNAITLEMIHLQSGGIIPVYCNLYCNLYNLLNIR